MYINLVLSPLRVCYVKPVSPPSTDVLFPINLHLVRFSPFLLSDELSLDSDSDLLSIHCLLWLHVGYRFIRLSPVFIPVMGKILTRTEPEESPPLDSRGSNQSELFGVMHCLHSHPACISPPNSKRCSKRLG